MVIRRSRLGDCVAGWRAVSRPRRKFGSKSRDAFAAIWQFLVARHQVSCSASAFVVSTARGRQAAHRAPRAANAQTADVEKAPRGM